MKLITTLSAAGLIGLAISPHAQAWFHGYSGGGFSRGGSAGGWQHSTTFSSAGVSHSSNLGGYEHSTQAGAGGVAHESTAGGYEHGTACGSAGCGHESDYGGYYHGTTASSNGTVTHTGAYGTTTTSYGNYYHQPAVAGYYGGGCYNCGSPGWGAAAAGAAVGATVGVAAGVAASGAAYSAGINAGYAAAAAPRPVAYASLPGGCFYRPLAREYSCGSMWLAPAYGANGVYYQVVAPP